MAIIEKRVTTPEKELGVQMAAQFVKTARLSAGKSQVQLASDVGTSTMQIHMIEHGKKPRGPTVTLLARIAAACGGTLMISMYCLK